jgi:hypothetical protein
MKAAKIIQSGCDRMLLMCEDEETRHFIVEGVRKEFNAKNNNSEFNSKRAPFSPRLIGTTNAADFFDCVQKIYKSHTGKELAIPTAAPTKAAAKTASASGSSSSGSSSPASSAAPASIGAGTGNRAVASTNPSSFHYTPLPAPPSVPRTIGATPPLATPPAPTGGPASTPGKK